MEPNKNENRMYKTFATDEEKKTKQTKTNKIKKLKKKNINTHK